MIQFAFAIVTLIGAALALVMAAAGSPAFLIGILIMLIGFTPFAMNFISQKGHRK